MRGSAGTARSRRAAMLAAAARLMREKGFAKTTIRDIARAVGMGSGSPFCHFRSKEAILAAIAETGLKRAVERAERVAARYAAPQRRLLALLRLHVDLLHGARSDFSAVTLHEWHALPAAEKERLRVLRRRYEAIWGEALASLLPARAAHHDVALCVRLLLGSLNWSLRWWRADGKRPARDLARTWTNIFAAQR